MITQSENPVAFSTLLFELEDAKDHLGDLIDALASDLEYTDDEFRIEFRGACDPSQDVLLIVAGEIKKI